MTDNRTMAEMLRAPTEGCAETIIVPLILPEKFELKHRAACRWLKKEPPLSITIWDDLVLKFINEFFPPSRTTNLRNEISNFQQKFDESFPEAWERYKDLLLACPHHGLTELHMLDTFYSALNPADQDSLNAATGGNLLEKSPQDALTIIENKSNVRNSRSKPIASPVNAYDNHSIILWDEMSIDLNKEEFKLMEQHVIFVVNSYKANVYGGVQLSATLATYYYFNLVIPNLEELHDQ
nr:reverse transcriptase domain-containing protein [Tanacetum cinerariifolium]